MYQGRENVAWSKVGLDAGWIILQAYDYKHSLFTQFLYCNVSNTYSLKAYYLDSYIPNIHGKEFPNMTPSR